MTEGIWSITELCQYLKLVLDSDELLKTCVVKGEISNPSLYPSGHWYLTLKDGNSQIAGVMFQGEARKLKFKPQDGMKVLAFGRVSIFPGRSQYQLILQELQPEGIGEFYIAFQQLKEKLEKEGLFDPARKRPIPFFPKVIGIVTSLQGAAIHDMLSILARRNPSIQIIVAPSAVQGNDAPQSLISALHRLQKITQVELIIISRGGGSPEELWAFNDEGLAREITRCSIPVISAVGHETDFTIADFVADQRAPTPSAAAEMVAPHRESLAQHLIHLYERLRLSLTRSVHQEENALSALLKRPVFRFPLERVNRESQTLDLLSRRLHDRFSALLQTYQTRLSNLSLKMDGLSPRHTLQRGYVVVAKGKRLLKSAQETENAGKITLIFHDGQVEATTLNSKKLKPAGTSQGTFDLSS